MPQRERKSLRDLAIYLLKDNGCHPEEFIEMGSVFEGFLDGDELGRVSSASAVLLVKASGRLFALTFRHGHTLVEPDSWEERFGCVLR